MSRFATFNELAELELSEVADFYESESKGLGKRFLVAVESALELVLQARGVRSTIVAFDQSFPFLRAYERTWEIARTKVQIYHRSVALARSCAYDGADSVEMRPEVRCDICVAVLTPCPRRAPTNHQRWTSRHKRHVGCLREGWHAYHGATVTSILRRFRRWPV